MSWSSNSEPISTRKENIDVAVAGLSIAGAAVALVVGAMASIIGGALGGIVVGGKALGNELAALMGGFYGPLAGVPGVFLGLIVLALISLGGA
jgi:hypothetical protein